jgi:glutamine synthetase
LIERNLLGAAGGPPSDGAAAVMGLLRHAGAISFIGMPTVNSYKRLVPGIWTPVIACHSQENKDALVRFAGRGHDRRVEYRGADGAASPYLLLAALLAAVRAGLEHPEPLDSGLRVDEAVSEAHVERWRSDGRPVLPASLAEAIAVFEADPTICGAFDPVIGPVLGQVKRLEWTLLGRAVSTAERTLYLRHY